MLQDQSPGECGCGGPDGNTPCSGADMRIVEVDTGADGRSLYLALSRMVETAGELAFDLALTDLTCGALESDLLAVFSATENEPPRLLAAAGTERGRDARSALADFVDRRWRQGRIARPAHQALGSGAVRTASVRKNAPACAGPSFIVADGAIGRRLCLTRQLGSETLTFWLGRAFRAAPALSDGLRELHDHVDLILALVLKHDRAGQSARSGDNAACHFERSLARDCPNLTPRERRVCGLIAAGLTSRDIADEMGISRNTVLTHRRRAYARLGISSQNELLRFVL